MLQVGERPLLLRYTEMCHLPKVKSLKPEVRLCLFWGLGILVSLVRVMVLLEQRRFCFLLLEELTCFSVFTFQPRLFHWLVKTPRQIFRLLLKFALFLVLFPVFTLSGGEKSLTWLNTPRSGLFLYNSTINVRLCAQMV